MDPRLIERIVDRNLELDVARKRRNNLLAPVTGNMLKPTPESMELLGAGLAAFGAIRASVRRYEPVGVLALAWA